MRIDLNADLGEDRAASEGTIARLMQVITSANVACGFHAGDPGLMRATVVQARDAGVAVGAHPGFPDPEGFGRRDLTVAPRDVEDFVVYQVGALAAIAATEGVRLQHVKPHGALFNMAARDAALADAIARAVAVIDRALILFGLPDSELIKAGHRAGLRTAREGFADRAYQSDGSLLPRDVPGAVVVEPDTAARRAVSMARDGSIETVTGEHLAVTVDTICVHGDTPDAVGVATAVRAALARAGVTVRAIAEP